ncbi:Fic family protein [Candidatus Gracilibacteria bacterium]|nr:Fic family protein [Candidatus Gracilibacteria bacterium]
MMFDPQQPYNDLPLLPPKETFDDAEISKQLVKTSRALAKLNGIDLLNNHKISEMMINPFLISESIQSNSIENIHTTVEEYYKEEISAKQLTGNNKEAEKYKDAIMYGFDQIKDNEMLLTNDIVKMQSIIVPNKPGIKSSPDKKIENSVTHEIIYTPPQGQKLLEDLMGNLDKYINDDEIHDVDPLIKAIIIHHQIESIHPFLDGNGRTGRMLMVLYLVLQGLLSLPMLFISGYINKYKDKYYAYLREANYTGNLKPLIIYLLEGIEEQSKNTITKIIKVNQLIDHVKNAMYDEGIKESDKLINAFIEQPYFTISSVFNTTLIPARTLNRYFKKLSEVGVIQKSAGSKGSYIYYELAGLIPLISEV